MVAIVGPPTRAIRNRPIAAELKELLVTAAADVGIQKIVVVSGGQTSNHAPHLKKVVGGWTGSRRHDNGRAADIELIRNGKTLTFTDQDGSKVEDFVTAAAALGANGIGAGVDYMGPKRLHVGFGRSPADHQQLVWGADNASANAPRWLREAARKGWGGANFFAAIPGPTSGFASVHAREGVWLRKGPGLAFDRSRLLEAGRRLTVLGLDGEWARVDLEGDGLIDGHVFAAFIASGEADGAEDGVEELVDEDIIAKMVAAPDSPARKGTPSDASRNSSRKPVNVG